jgi:hypothetical protein
MRPNHKSQGSEFPQKGAALHSGNESEKKISVWGI